MKSALILAVGFASVLPLAAEVTKPLTKIQEREKYMSPARGMDAATRLRGFELRRRMEADSRFRNVAFRSVGPEIESCRVVDVDVASGSPETILVAYASGGLWKSTNQGTSWEPIFDEESSMTIGDVAAVDANTIWVGTGENNSSRTSYAGTGVFKTTDGGKTWANMGLADSHHIGRIVVDPRNHDVVYVAALGHLYTENDERGVYKTSDGGKSWERVLFVDERTGAVDLMIDPKLPDTLYAATWERARRAFNFLESGPGSALYKSVDAGKSWSKLPFPADEYTGRIGIDICALMPNILYATVDNQQLRPDSEPLDEDTPTGELTLSRLRRLTQEEFIALDKGVISRFLKGNGYPSDLKAEELLEKVKKGEVTLQDIIDYSSDADRALTESNIIGQEVYRSNDGGKSWKKTHEGRIDQLTYTYGYYFGQVRVSPDDPDHIYVMGVPLIASEDGGKTFHGLDGPGVHGDHHALWIDPRDSRKIILGTDGGLNFSWDAGATWRKVNNAPVGQFTTINVDMAEPYTIYGGLQDNGVLMGPSTYKPGKSDPWEWRMIYGGDGAAVQIDSRDNATVYTEYQFGNAARLNTKTEERKRIKPKHELKEKPLRFNWVSPIVLSSHNQDILYMGSNRVYRSMNRGDSWTPISGDLTSNPEQGDVPYGTITALCESPKTFGLLYAGTDDGRVWVTRDGGVKWSDITQGVAKDRWVTRIVASAHDEGTVFLSQNGYRNDDFAAIAWRSTDFGKTWTSIAAGLPSEPINVIREDPKSKTAVYVGTDLGCFVSLDRGASWEALAGALPHAPVHDLVIHPRDSDIVLGTHGRSVFVASVAEIQKLTPEIMGAEAHLFETKEVTASRHWGYGIELWVSWYREDPKTTFAYWLKQAGAAKITVKDDLGSVVRELTDEGEAGLNYVDWDLIVDRAKAESADKARAAKAAKEKKEKPTPVPLALKDPYEAKHPLYVKPGTYTIALTAAGKTSTRTLEVKPPKEER